MDTSPLRIGVLCRSLASRAEKAGADPLGYYVAPLAYAPLQVLEQAITAVGSTDDAALSDYTRQATFDTVVGRVTFGEGGGKRSNTQVVVYPPETASASVIYPYAKARR